MLIGIARGSRQGVQRRRYAHFAPAAWSPVRPDGGAALRASSAALDEAVARGDLAALGDLLADSTDLLMREALELSRDAYEIRGEVLFTEDGLAGSPLDVLGVLLHEATHAVAASAASKMPAARAAITTATSRRSPRSSACTSCGTRRSAGLRRRCPQRRRTATPTRLRSSSARRAPHPTSAESAGRRAPCEPSSAGAGGTSAPPEPAPRWPCCARRVVNRAKRSPGAASAPCHTRRRQGALTSGMPPGALARQPAGSGIGHRRAPDQRPAPRLCTSQTPRHEAIRNSRNAVRQEHDGTLQANTTRPLMRISGAHCALEPTHEERAAMS